MRTAAGDVWVTDAARPVLWHLTPGHITAGAGQPAALVVADDSELSIVELGDNASQGRMVTQVRDPSFRDAASVAHVKGRLLVVNAGWSDPAPDTLVGVDQDVHPHAQSARASAITVS